MTRFNYAVLLIGNHFIPCRAVSKGWKIIKPKQLPGDKGRSVCAFAAGSAVAGVRVPLPAAREAEIRRAAPFAVEEELATEIGENHFALGRRQDGTSERDLRIISNEEMQEWVAALQSHGLKNTPIFSVADMLPENCLLEAGQHVYGRIGSRTFCLDANLPEDVFVAMAQGVDGLTLYGQKLARPLGIHPAGPGARNDEELVCMLAAMDVPESAVNLRQGKFSVKHTLSKQQLLDWRRTAALVAIAGALWFANLLSGTRAMDVQATKLQGAMDQILSTEFPEADGNYNRVLALYQGGAEEVVKPLPSVVDVTALLYKAVDEIDETQIRSFRYDAKRREAICVVSASNFASLDAFSEALNKGGLQVSGGDARQDREGVVGEFKLGAS